MTRRQKHQWVLAGATGGFIVFSVSSLLRGQSFWIFLASCGVYVGFLILYSLVCWFDVPRHLRKRPERPSDFGVFRVGHVTGEMARVLHGAQVVKDQTFGGVRHQLFLLEKGSEAGTWRAQIEVSGERILAYALSYESVESPVLDRGEQHGEGRFLVVPG